jgi:hypothetical protein
MLNALRCGQAAIFHPKRNSVLTHSLRSQNNNTLSNLCKLKLIKFERF